MPFKLGALNKRLAALGADVDPWSMSVKVFAHRSIVSEQLATTLRYQQYKTTALAQTDGTQQQVQKLTNLKLPKVTMSTHRDKFLQKDRSIDKNVVPGNQECTS